MLYAGQDTVLLKGLCVNNGLMEQNVKEGRLEEAIEICGLQEFVTRYGFGLFACTGGRKCQRR